jgi:CheY-like chemotaxis protein
MHTILIIEDEAAMRRVMARTLREVGFTVLEAENGRTGLQLFNAHMPPLVITDLLMPDKDGLETIRELRRSAKDIKIIATSGGGRAGRLDFLEVATEFGADLVLRKPFRGAELLDAVARLIGSAGGTSPAEKDR